MSSGEESLSKKRKLEENEGKEEKESQRDLKSVDSVDGEMENSQICGERIEQEINMADRSDLTDDLWLEVFKRIFPLKERLRLIFICKSWKVLVEKSLTNVTKLNFRDFFSILTDFPYWKPPKFEVLRSILEMVGQNLKSLKLTGCIRDDEYEDIRNLRREVTEAEISLLIRTCPKLTELEFDLDENLFYSAEVFLLMEGRLTKVESFKLKNFPKDNDEEVEENLHRVVQSMPNLKHLSLEWCRFEDQSGKFLRNLPKSLESLHIRNTIVTRLRNLSNLEEFLRQHPNLKEIRHTSWGSDVEFQEIPHLLADFCPNLTKVELSGCIATHMKTSEGRRIYSFLGDLHNLKELDVSWNFYFGSEAILAVSTNCQQLEKLDISGTTLTSADLLNLAMLKNLKWLQMRGIRDGQLTDAVMMAILPQIGAKLECLDISYNREISDSILTTLASECPQLSRLNITEMTNFTTERLAKFLDEFTSNGDWKKQTWRELRIATEVEISLDRYEGRVKIISDSYLQQQLCKLSGN